ncbi:delta-12 fatty acid desaturase, partial [Catenaria anguillulae PL171]
RNADKAGYQPIDMSIKEIRDKIPAEYFVRSTFWSSMYLVHDLILASALFYGALHIDSFAASSFADPTLALAAKWGLWAAYWIAQGIVCTGIWVIAHECGHQAFSPSKAINNSVGYILHTALLVPYHSWRITHSTHHKSTNHMTRDQVFVPSTREQVIASNPKLKQRNESPEYDSGFHSLLEESPIYSLVTMIGMLLFGWPAYIISNVSGQTYPEYGWASHFFPTAPFFERRDYWDIVSSDIGVLAVLGGLGYASSVFGIAAVVKFYVIPYLFVNHWLVLITYLQHTHKELPHYSPEAFTFLRGAVATVDRDYGILNYFFHNIADSHVAHHLFSQMPHYNAVKATKIIREALKGTPYYVADNTPIAKALWQTWTECKFVEPVDSADVLWYNN